MSDPERPSKPPEDDAPTAGPAPAPSEDELPTMRISTSLIAQIEQANAWLSPADEPSNAEDAMPTLDLPTSEIARAEAIALDAIAEPREAPPPETTLELPRTLTQAIETTTDVTLDSLPPELRARVLPFQEKSADAIVIATAAAETPPAIQAPAPSLELTIDVPAEALSRIDVPFERAPEPGDGALTLAQAAAVAADLASVAPKVVLERHGIAHEAWIAAERRWVARIAGELERGDTTMRDAFDDAFLEARDARRGAFGLASVAELAVELERETADASSDIGNDVADGIRVLRARKRGAARAREIDDAMALARSRHDARSRADRSKPEEVS